MMSIRGGRQTQLVLESDLQNSGRREVTTPNDAVNARFRIVQHRREMVVVDAIASAKDGIPKEFSRIPREIEATFVSQCLMSRIETKSQRSFDASPRLARDALRATGSGVPIASIRRAMAGFSNLCATAFAGVDPILGDEPFEHGFVSIPILRLQAQGIPFEAEPFEVAYHAVDIARLGPFEIQIFEPQNDPCRVCASIEPTQQGREQRAGMGSTRRRGCKPAGLEAAGSA